MEMEKAGIDSAPSLARERTVTEIYRDLGQIVNRIAGLLQLRGKGHVPRIP